MRQCPTTAYHSKRSSDRAASSSGFLGTKRVRLGTRHNPYARGPDRCAAAHRAASVSASNHSVRTADTDTGRAAAALDRLMPLDLDDEQARALLSRRRRCRGCSRSSRPGEKSRSTILIGCSISNTTVSGACLGSCRAMASRGRHSRRRGDCGRRDWPSGFYRAPALQLSTPKFLHVPTFSVLPEIH